MSVGAHAAGGTAACRPHGGAGGGHGGGGALRLPCLTRQDGSGKAIRIWCESRERGQATNAPCSRVAGTRRFTCVGTLVIVHEMPKLALTTRCVHRHGM